MLSLKNFRFYRGKSMKGTFMQGDLLHIEAVKFNSIKKGDIIVFKKPKNLTKKAVVHRVVKKESTELITRGDNNKFKDTEKITKNEIIGRVKSFERKSKKFPVKNGLAGILHSKFYRTKLLLKKNLFWIMIIPYNIIKRSNILSTIIKLKTEKIWLISKTDLIVKIMKKKKTIARWYPEKETFFCRKPYDLFLKKPFYSDKDIKDFIQKSFLRYSFSESDTEENLLDNH